MNDVLQVADSIAVLYLGEMAAQVERSSVNQQQLIELITTGRVEGSTVAAGSSSKETSA